MQTKNIVTLLSGLLMIGQGACGTSSGAATQADVAFVQPRNECPAAVKRGQVNVVYAPGEAMEVWSLPKKLVGAGPVDGLQDLRKYVSQIAAAMSKDAAVQTGRVVRFEAQEFGASIVVVDRNSDRLDITRAQFDRRAALLAEGQCEDETIDNKSLVSLSNN